MQEFIEYVVKALVDRPGEVAVDRVEDGGTVVFEVRCSPDDIGRVIGKGGKTIRALRTLLQSAAAREEMRASIEIIE